MPTSLMKLLDTGNLASNDKGKENKGKEKNARYYRGRNLTSKECLTL